MTVRQAKYVVISRNGEERMIVFPYSIAHKYVSKKFEPENQVVSAGFVRFNPECPTCYGRSDSIGISSRPHIDSMLAKKHFGDENNEYTITL